ncbi:hypothetical protein ACK6D9_07580 [Hoeflea sp. Naph1]|uniref:hypothetical protein n=1 Tax=Hoeflea sp. Naph1 TaxID=3388653 RepID=UPI00398FD498
MQLNRAQLNEFEQNGILVIQAPQGTAGINLVQLGIPTVIGAGTVPYGMDYTKPQFSAEIFDAVYVDLFQANWNRPHSPLGRPTQRVLLEKGPISTPVATIGPRMH